MSQEYNYDDEPARPPHPSANEEFKLVPSMTKMNEVQLDLNPDLSDDDIEVDDVNLDDPPEDSVPLQSKPVKRNFEIYDSESDYDRSPAFESPLPRTEVPLSAVHRQLLSRNKDTIMNYLDSELMKIQRKNITAYVVVDTRERENILKELIDGYLVLTNFINAVVQNNNSLQDYGQYLITIAGDSLECIERFPLNRPILETVLILFQKLDSMFVSNLSQLDSTDRVRIASIAERARIVTINVSIKYKVNAYKNELGKIYENILQSID